MPGDGDGSQKQRLTFFNQPGHPEYTGRTTNAADSSWSRDGTQIVGYVLSRPCQQTGIDVLITLNPLALR